MLSVNKIMVTICDDTLDTITKRFDTLNVLFVFFWIFSKVSKQNMPCKAEKLWA